jgi:hypothetical protein
MVKPESELRGRTAKVIVKELVEGVALELGK